MAEQPGQQQPGHGAGYGGDDEPATWPPDRPPPPASPPPPPAAPPATPVPPGWAPVQPPPSGWGQAAPGGSGPPPAAPGWGTPPPAPGWGAQPSAPAQQPPYGQQPGQPAWGTPAVHGWAPPPKPGVIPLRPLGIGEILDGAITAIRRDPKVMLGVSALVVTVSTVVQSLITWVLLGEAGSVLSQPSDAVTDEQLFELAGSSAVATVISLAISLVTQVVLTGILTFSVSKAVLGQHVGAGEAWQATRRRIPALIGLTLVVFLLFAVAVLVPIVPGIVALAAGAGALGVVLLVVGVPLAIALFLAVAVLSWFGAPVLILERQRIVRSLRRSARLARPSFWRVLGLWLLLQLLVAILGGILGGPLAVIATMAFDDPFGAPSLALQAVGTILASTVTLPFAAAVTVLVYVDQRMRREALDLELTRAVGLAVPGQSATPGTGPLPGPGTAAGGGPGGPAWSG